MLLPTVLHQRDVQRLLEVGPLPTRPEFPEPGHVPGLYVATVPVKSAAEGRGLHDRLLAERPPRHQKHDRLLACFEPASLQLATA